jgi:hypothetical protein
MCRTSSPCRTSHHDLVDGPGVSSHRTLQVGGERLIVRYSRLLLRRGIRGG